MRSSIFAIPGTFWMDRVDVSGEMVNIEDDECNPVRIVEGIEQPHVRSIRKRKIPFSGELAGITGGTPRLSDEESTHFPQQIPVRFRRFWYICLLIMMGMEGIQAQIHAPTISQLIERYLVYREDAIGQKRFTISDLEPLFQKHQKQSEIQFQILGHSLQCRPVYLASYGQGDISVLLWSQMHGDESTATMALLDLFNFLESTYPEDQSFLSALKTRLTLYFIPMLNPDGAEEFQRRNAASIDLNRDALDLSSPESRLLKHVRDSLNPIFGFNLHDQSIYYRAGRTGKQVAMAFLAPAYDYDKTINDVRLRSMQLIAHLNDTLQTIIPERVAVYDDSFEPRAFGDNIQKWGTSTILIESGGYPDDPEKQYLRQLNFMVLIKSFESTLMKSYDSKTIDEYEKIPENERRMLALILQDLQVPMGNSKYKIDVGYLTYEMEDEGEIYYASQIVDVGDLSTYSGLHEFSAGEMDIIQGKWYPETFDNLEAFSQKNWIDYIKGGYLGFILDDVPDLPFPPLLFKQSGNSKDPLKLNFSPGQNPAFLLQSRTNGERWVVFNGKVYPLTKYIETLQSWLRNQ